MSDRLSLKWIDGNDDIVVSGTTVHINGQTDSIPSYNVDDPTFWTPLSVLSGLASGFCERRAVLDSNFITEANGGTTTWLQKVETPEAEQARAKITSNFMNNLALGISDSSVAFKSANASFVSFGAAVSSNYMIAMDSAIASVIGGTTGVFVQSNGSAYTSFGMLASNAADTAGSNGSALTSNISSGAINYRGQFAQALPVEWAKERKWLLDELQWTTGGKAISIGMPLTVDYLQGTIANTGVFTSTGAGTLTSGLGGAFTLAQGLDNTSKTVQSAGYQVSCSIASEGATVNTTVCFSAAGEGDLLYGIDYAGFKSINMSSVAVGGSNYCVTSGGFLSIASTGSAGTVVVCSGGTVSIGTPAIKINRLEIQPGATIIPYVSAGSAYSYATSITYNYRAPNANIFDATGTTAVRAVYSGSVSSDSGLNVAVLGGSDTIITDNLEHVYVSGATAAIACRKVDYLQIDNGGVVYVTTDNALAASGALEILAGGTLIISHTLGEDTFTELYNTYLVGELELDARTYIYSLTAYEDATLSIDYVPSSSYAFGNDAVLVYCCPFGIVPNQAGAGWVSVEATRIGDTGSNYLLLGASDEAAGIAAISSYISTYLPTVKDRISVISGGVSYPADPTLKTASIFSGTVQAEYTAAIVAINSGGVAWHYPDFYVRQFATPNEIASASSSVSAPAT